MTVEPTYADITGLVHRWLHLAVVKGTGPPEDLVAAECWRSSAPLADMPEWAEQARAAGEPASSWCPVVNPSLTDG